MSGFQDLKKKYENEVKNLNDLQNEIQSLAMQRRTLDAQLHECSEVKKELDMMKEGYGVYKSLGPILLKVELVEAKQNVATRIEKITKEIQKIDNREQELDKKDESLKTSLSALTSQMQKMMKDSLPAFKAC